MKSIFLKLSDFYYLNLLLCFPIFLSLFNGLGYFFLDTKWKLYLAIFLLLLSLSLFFYRITRLRIVGIFFGLLCCAFIVSTLSIYTHPLRKHDSFFNKSRLCSFTGKIDDFYKRKNYFIVKFVISSDKIVCKKQAIDNRDFKVKLLFKGSHLPNSVLQTVKHGREISLVVRTLSHDYPYIVDARHSFYMKDMMYNFTAFPISFKVLETKYSSNYGEKILTKILNIRTSFLAKIIQTVTPLEIENKGIVIALLTGNRSFISATSYDSFENSGTMHLLAISGLHVGTISFLIFIYCRFVLSLFFSYSLKYDNKVFSSIIAIIFSLLYAILIEPAFPIIRAWLMTSFVFLTFIFGLQAISLYVLALVASIILIFYPSAFLLVSFQLSIFATATLIICSYNFRDRVVFFNERSMLDNILFFIKFTIFSSFIISVVLIPITLFFFKQINFNSVLFNSIAIPFMTFIIMPLILIVIILSFNQLFLQFSLKVLSFFVGKLIAILKLSQYTTGLVLKLGGIPLPLFIGTMMIIGFVMIFIRNPFIFLLPILLVVSLVTQATYNNILVVTQDGIITYKDRNSKVIRYNKIPEYRNNILLNTWRLQSIDEIKNIKRIKGICNNKYCIFTDIIGVNFPIAYTNNINMIPFLCRKYKHIIYKGKYHSNSKLRCSGDKSKKVISLDKFQSLTIYKQEDDKLEVLVLEKVKNYKLLYKKYFW